MISSLIHIINQNVILNKICKYSDPESLNNLRIVTGLNELKCEVKIKDPDDLIKSFNEVNKDTAELARRILEKGSINTFFNLDNLLGKLFDIVTLKIRNPLKIENRQSFKLGLSVSKDYGFLHFK